MSAPAPSPALSVVIVTFNSARHVGACLRSLAEHAPRAPLEIIVVDNASADQTAAVVAREWPAVRLLSAERNLGFAAAMNRGIRASVGQRLLLLNPDARVTSGAIDTLMHTLDHEPRVAIAGPRIEDDEGRSEVSFGRHLGLWAEAAQKLRVRGQEQRWPLVAAWVEHATRVPSFPDWVSGACWLARRDVIETVGLFDERFFLYVEDVDLCARVRKAGHRVAFVPSALVRHTRGASRDALPDHARGHYRRSQLAFYDKYRPRTAHLIRTYLKLRGALPDTSSQ